MGKMGWDENFHVMKARIVKNVDVGFFHRIVKNVDSASNGLS